MYHIEYQNYYEDLSNGFLRSYRLNISSKLDELAKGHILRGDVKIQVLVI